MKAKAPGLLSRPRLIGSVDERMISLMRLLLASSALFIIFIDPSEPDRLAPLTYVALILYVVYSGILYSISMLTIARFRSLPRWAPWVDVAWYVALIALSSGTNSIFFFFFFFSVLVASFTWGFRSGLRLTIASALLFTVVGYFTAADPHFQLNRFLLRPIYLLVLGYMISYWGGHEVRLRERLKLLRDISTFLNPRFGIDHTINWIMERIRTFYEADSVLLFVSPDGGVYRMRRVDRAGHSGGSKIVGDELAKVFLSPGPDEALIHRARDSVSLSYDVARGELSTDTRSYKPLVNAFESKSFLSIPVHYRTHGIGRCYVIGGNYKYTSSDVDFVIQAIEQVIPVIDNIRLVDHLASDAAEREREKIARDIHDSVIQPYVGLQLGLAAVTQKLERNDVDTLDSLRELSAMTTKGIQDLRHYVKGIKSTEATQDVVLVPAVRRFAMKFSEATGIQVSVETFGLINVNDRLAGEVFQMISEGLSNVRRHTSAQVARAVLEQADNRLVLRIENEAPNGGSTEFYPKSLAERTDALGGELTVEVNNANDTVVVIDIPL